MAVEFYSQKQLPWGPKKLGTCNLTFAQDACLITSCTNLFPRIMDFSMNPEELNAYCLKNNLYIDGCSLSLPALSKKLGLNYSKVLKQPSVTCIAETDKYAPGSHFFMLKPDGTIIDPLDLSPSWKKNTYHIVSYRVFDPIQKITETVKETTQQNDPQQEITGNDTNNQIPVERVPESITEPPIGATDTLAQSVGITSDQMDKIINNPELIIPEKPKSFWQIILEIILKFIKK